jgi:membrane protein
MAGNRLERWKRLTHEAREALDDRSMATKQGRLSRFQHFVHFWVLVVRSFVRNRCPVRASSLAYASLLALIPMLALVLSVTTSILKAQGEEPIRRFVEMLINQVTPYVEPAAGPVGDEQRARAAQAREEAVAKINEFIQRTRSGALSATSAVVLLFVAISMLSRIEATFNDIWGVARGRPWHMQIVLYWTAITLGPIALISTLGLASVGQLKLAAMTQGTAALKPLATMLQSSFVTGIFSTFLPGLVLVITFSLIYLLLPNTRVRFSAALVGGLTSGLAWLLNNKLSVLFVSRITSNAAIYGSLAMVPVFMIGLYLGWLILLFGAQVAYAFQNRQAYLQERLAEGINQRGREFAALRIMTRLAGSFLRGEPPPGLNRLARECGVPTRLASELLATLARARLLVEVIDREPGYLPARPLDHITARDVIVALRTTNGQDLETAADGAREWLRRCTTEIQEAEAAVAARFNLRELAERLYPPTAAATPRT